MSKICTYVSKKEITDYKKTVEKAIKSTQKKLRAEFGKTFNFMIVGSAKRNLVVQKGNSHWDVDYQLWFHSPKYDEVDAKELKEYVKTNLGKELGNKYSVRLSTSVITICLMADDGKHAIKSFDLALIRQNPKNQEIQILRGKNLDTNSKEKIVWESLKSPSKFYKERKKIKGKEMWDTLREIFLNHKCENMEKDKDKQEPTFSLYLKSIKETLDQL